MRVRITKMILKIAKKAKSGHRKPSAYIFIANTVRMKTFASLGGSEFALGPTKQYPKQTF